jgi:amino acid adenylation domain-containing protein
MIGILGAGAAYVPIDPADPPARVAAIVLDAGVRVLLTAADGPPLQDVRTLSVDGRAIDVLAIDGLLQSSRESAAATDADGGTPAYVIYTSGSTGNPKGVVVPHRAIARLVLETDYVQIEPADRVALASNVAFDAATFEIWGALLNGATLVVVSPEVATSPALLAREIRQRRLSVLFVTTAVFNRVAADDPGGFGPLRALLFGGEASSPRAVAAVLAAGTPTALVHVYGPTECTTFATAHRVTGLDPRAATVPIGLPIAHTTACIMDDRGTPAAHGVAGELWLGGDGVAIGYHGLAAPTAERFVTREDVRMYRTGDRCRVNADGVIEFVARMDRQLKIRGFRIEPAEVERTLAGHEAVAGVVVDAVGEGDEHRLVACVTAPPGRRVDAAGLVRYLGERLPRFAIPAISIVAELPLTANGKIDRRRLAGLVTAASEGRQFAAPRDPLEEELARLWEELLQVSPIGITDDFFLLGGHSLLGAAMMDRVEKQFGRRVPISALLQHPTIEGLAGTLWEAERSSAGPLTVLREAGTRPPLFFLHGDLNGAGLYCARLARMLDASQPVYSLAPLGLDGRSSPPSIEGMAAEYVAIIRACRPEGPIAIGGYCHGASIAFEIARRLAGERQVTSVLMVYPPAVEPRLAPVDAAIRAAGRLLGRDVRRRVALTLRVGDALRVLAQSRGRGAGRFLAAKLARAFSSASPSRRRPAGAAASAGAPGERHDPRTWARYIRAVAAYVPRRYEGRVRLFMPEIRTDNETRGWHHAAPRAVVCGIAGDHRGCITTHLDSLARALDRELAGVAHDPGGAPLPPAALATARDHHELT